MFNWISNIINAVTNFIANFSKLNEATIRSVRVFGYIIVILVASLFLIKLFLRDDLYDKVMTSNPITFTIILAIAIISYGWYSQQRTMNAVMSAIKQEKKTEKESSERVYEQTSKIEDSARELTKSLIGKLNADVSTIEMLHNKDLYDGGVHCRYYSECYPSMRDGIFFDAKQYQRMPTSVLPIISYMEKNEYLFDSIDNLKKIDMGYAKAVEAQDNHHIALKFMHRKNGKPLGILTCTWRQGLGENLPDEENIKKEMNSIASKLELLLDLE